jgi:TPR repeat protein
MQMRAFELIAAACLAVAAAFVSTHVGNAQTPALACARFSNLLDDGTPLAIAVQSPAVKKVEPSQAEAACRSALQADPVNPTVMFQLARALILATKQLQAIKYYLDAADRGHAGAMNDLGGLFEYGIGVPKNLSTAIEWYQSAAGLAHTGAMTHLGQLNENGIDIPQDLAAARRWFEKAARLGNADAMSSLAHLLTQAGDVAAAASWYNKAAEQGLASAMNTMGEFSEAGMGVPQDYGSARDWYRKAIELGDADAMGNLGALFESGRGGPQNLQVAREWYVRGAALNGRAAMHNLGAMLENGRGTSKNLSEAKFWYERAAALGYPRALNALGRLHLAGAGVPKNYARAKSLFEQAVALGDAKAMNNLGVIHLDGRGVQRDIAVARTWFEKAVALGNAEAHENLKRLDQAGLTDGTQIAGRRASCVQTCAELHRSYVNSVCERYSSIADEDKSERTKCIDTTLMLASQCRVTCREWAPTLLSDNKCLSCFRDLIACGIKEAPNKEGDKRPFSVDSGECLGSLSECMTNCGKATSSSEVAN